MKKVLAIILSLVFVLTMATVSFADAGSITSADVYEWAVGAVQGNWPSANVIVHNNYAVDAYVMMDDKIDAGSVSVTLDGAATSAEAGDRRGAATAEHGFYFKADIAPVKDGDTVTGATVNSAYLLTLHNETHLVTLYSVANGTETKLDDKDLDGVVEGLIDAEPITGDFAVGHVTLKAVFTADGEVAIYAGAGDEASTKVISYTPDAAAPAGDDVVLMGRSIDAWDGASTTSPACFDAYSAEAGNPEMGDTTAIVAVVAIVALLGCGVTFTASKKRI